MPRQAGTPLPDFTSALDDLKAPDPGFVTWGSKHAPTPVHSCLCCLPI